MKKLFFIAAIAGAALVSCTKNELAPSVTEQQEISFIAPIIGNLTKGDVQLIGTYPKTETFGVFGLYSADKFKGYTAQAVYMTDVEATPTTHSEDTDGTWVTNGYYWPKNGGVLTFAAYSPYDETNVKASHNDSGIHFDDYVVTANANTDLLFSDRVYNQTKAGQKPNNSIYYGVELVFNHALSAVKFMVNTTAELKNSGYEFVLEEIILKNINNKGDFNQRLSAYVESTNETPSTPAASLDDWNLTSDEIPYTAFSGTLTVNSETAVSTTTIDGTDKYANLILMPQALDADNAAKIQVKYKYRHSGMAAGAYVEDNVVETDLSVTGCTQWLRGYRYVYTLTLDLDKIYFAPNISNWKEDADPIDGPDF